jgi:hypothetical protein
MDIEHAIALIDAVDRTLLDARIVLDVDARLGVRFPRFPGGF